MTNLNVVNAGSEGQAKHREYPTEWQEKYTDQYKEHVCRIIDWLNEKGKNQAWLCKLANLNRTTFHLVLQGKYDGNIGRFVKQALSTIENLEARNSINETPFHAHATVAKLVGAACARARKYRAFAIINGDVGTGKTRSLMEYQEDHPNTILVESGPNMSPTALMDSIMEQAKIEHQMGGRYLSRERKFTTIVGILKDTDTLIIVDEAETVSKQTLHHLRRLRDMANIGVVLAGTTRLYNLISPVNGEFDQIRSRVCFWPKVIRGITKADAEAVILSSFDDLNQEIDDAIIKTFWQYTKGSMRLLVEQLIPAVRDYGLKKHPDLTPEVIQMCARDVLSLQ